MPQFASELVGGERITKSNRFSWGLDPWPDHAGDEPVFGTTISPICNFIADIVMYMH